VDLAHAAASAEYNPAAIATNVSICLFFSQLAIGGDGRHEAIGMPSMKIRHAALTIIERAPAARSRTRNATRLLVLQGRAPA
jgi:hypothetical protein